ncbi:MAG: transposase, partial [Burkholderiales bacterium]|nr:transposase [Burkholderiales bacterium]
MRQPGDPEVAHREQRRDRPIDAGKPWQNGRNESFDGRLWDEFLNVEWFRTRREARIVI